MDDDDDGDSKTSLSDDLGDIDWAGGINWPPLK
jgi:hypothetical protein